MPNVGGKKYPYTAAGMKAAAKARKKAKAVGQTATSRIQKTGAKAAAKAKPKAKSRRGR